DSSPERPVWRFATSSTTCARRPFLLRKGFAPSVQSTEYSSPCLARMDSVLFFKEESVLSVEKRKLKSTSTEPGTTLAAPVPAWMLETWKLVGGKLSLPLSHCVFASSASAGASRWIGFFTNCG